MNDGKTNICSDTDGTLEFGMNHKFYFINEDERYKM